MEDEVRQTRELILNRIDAFLETKGMSEREFGLQAIGDHKFIKRLRSGFGVTLTVIERAETFMDGSGEVKTEAA